MEYKKHRLNIYPEMSEDEFEELKASMAEKGYDNEYPIILFEGAIIDGWNRYRAATKLGIERKFKEFKGTKIDAFEYIVQTNKRRSLSSSQKAAIAVEAEDVYAELEAAVEEERRRKQAETLKETHKEGLFGGINSPKQRDSKQHEESKTRTKLAKKFNTNPRYISDVKKLREEEPDVFKSIVKGEKTITEVKKEARSRKAEKIAGNEEWPLDQLELKKKVEAGESVAINMNKHFHLLKWAQDNNKYVRVDRYTEWGNPFELPKDGNRDEVCDAYENHYFPYKKSLHLKIADLEGKVLGCHCHPQRCHAHFLSNLANSNNNE